MPDNRSNRSQGSRRSGTKWGGEPARRREDESAGPPRGVPRGKTRAARAIRSLGRPAQAAEAQSGERLQKYLARAGVASRRTSEEYILAGRVRVNGKIVKELGTRVDPDGDLVEFDGQPVVPMEREPLTYLLYKPRGYITTVTDPHGRPTVLSLVPGDERVYPVGRLDFDSEGLLLLTNDGDLAHRLMHPRFQHEKEYLVLVQGKVSPDEIAELARGVHIDDEGKDLFVRAQVRPAQLRGRWRDESSPQGATWLSIDLQEGKKRQIRRMLDVVGHPVQRLIRVRVGSMELGNLQPGQGRWLTKQEILSLRQEVGLEKKPSAPKSDTPKDRTVEKDQHRHRRTGGIGQEHRRRAPRK